MKQPLRVLHVMDSLGEGGAEQNLLTLVRRLGLPACEHDLAWLYDDDRLLPAFRPHVTALVPLHSGRGIGLLGAARRLAEYIRRRRPDVVHAKLIRAQFVARFAARLAGGVPVITTWECVSYNERMYIELGRRAPLLRAATRALDALSGVGDKHFIAVSQQVAEHNARKLGVSPTRVSVVYNAIEPDRIIRVGASEIERLRATLGVRSGAPLLLSVGRLVDQKSHETTIAAMPAILAAHPDAMLVIAGQGPLEEALRAQVRRLGIEGRVQLLGPRKDVPTLLQAADLFVFASTYEGLGIALMEALAAGLPVVASRIPTSLEVAQEIDTVRFFEPEDPAGLARSALTMIAERGAARDRARKHADAVLRRFSPEAMAEGFFAVASRVVDG